MVHCRDTKQNAKCPRLPLGVSGAPWTSTSPPRPRFRGREPKLSEPSYLCFKHHTSFCIATPRLLPSIAIKCATIVPVIPFLAILVLAPGPSSCSAIQCMKKPAPEVESRGALLAGAASRQCLKLLVRAQSIRLVSNAHLHDCSISSGKSLVLTPGLSRITTSASAAGNLSRPLIHPRQAR